MMRESVAVAISRDVSSQLLKVVDSRRLIYIHYEEFEKVMSQWHEVLKTSDDETTSYKD